VRQRVARLQATGIMQVVAVADPMTLGYKAMAMVAISAYTWSVAPEATADAG